MKAQSVNELTLDNTPFFFPPLSVQRRYFISQVLSKYKCTRVLDCGCGTGSLLQYLRSQGFSELHGVDINKQSLEIAEQTCGPLITHYITPVNPRLTIFLWYGNFLETKIDSSPHFDAFVATEVIEHVYPEQIPKFEEFLFEQPGSRIIIVTTPNRDFNEWFPMNKNSFRNSDHKFEWTRKEFEKWCENVYAKYKLVNVEISGVGKGPNGDMSKGFATQCAVFVKKEKMKISNLGTTGFKLFAKILYPCKQNEISDEEKICQDAMFLYLQEVQLSNNKAIETSRIFMGMESLCSYRMETLVDCLKKHSFNLLVSKDNKFITIKP